MTKPSVELSMAFSDEYISLPRVHFRNENEGPVSFSKQKIKMMLFPGAF